MKPSNKFAELLRVYRLKKGLTQDELSKEVGISRVSIARIESGSQLPFLDNAVRLANCLGISLQELQDAVNV